MLSNNDDDDSDENNDDDQNDDDNEEQQDCDADNKYGRSEREREEFGDAQRKVHQPKKAETGIERRKKKNGGKKKKREEIMIHHRSHVTRKKDHAHGFPNMKNHPRPYS